MAILGPFGNFWANVWGGIADFFASIWTGLVGFWLGLTDGRAIAIQTALLVAGGLWGYYLYRRRREFQATVRISAAARMARHGAEGLLIFIRIHLVNESAAFIDVVSLASLMTGDLPEAGKHARFTVDQKDHPLNYVYGDPDEPKQPNLAEPGDAEEADEGGEMEPHECIETEVVFLLASVPDLLAVRLSVAGTKPEGRFPRGQRLIRWVLREDEEGRAAEWATFAILDQEALIGSEYIPITSPHDAGV